MISKDEIQILKKLGDRIKLLREKKGFSQHELSIEAEIPKNQIGRIERQEINTTILTLHKIAKALDIDVTELLKTEKEN